MKIALKDPRAFTELIIKKGYSKNSFAKKAQLGQPTLVHISNGKQNPSPASAKKIIDALEVSFDDIFKFEDRKPRNKQVR